MFDTFLFLFVPGVFCNRQSGNLCCFDLFRLGVGFASHLVERFEHLVELYLLVQWKICSIFGFTQKRSFHYSKTEKVSSRTVVLMLIIANAHQTCRELSLFCKYKIMIDKRDDWKSVKHSQTTRMRELRNYRKSFKLCIPRKDLYRTNPQSAHHI